MATSYRTVGLSRLGRKDIELASNQGDGDDLMLIAATALSETEGTQELTVTGLWDRSLFLRAVYPVLSMFKLT